MGGECGNGFCEYQYNGWCNADEEVYLECEEQFWTADDDEEEDYAFADYDCEYGLFGDE